MAESVFISDDRLDPPNVLAVEIPVSISAFETLHVRWDSELKNDSKERKAIDQLNIALEGIGAATSPRIITSRDGRALAVGAQEPVASTLHNWWVWDNWQHPADFYKLRSPRVSQCLSVTPSALLVRLESNRHALLLMGSQGLFGETALSQGVRPAINDRDLCAFSVGRSVVVVAEIIATNDSGDLREVARADVPTGLEVQRLCWMRSSGPLLVDLGREACKTLVISQSGQLISEIGDCTGPYWPLSEKEVVARNGEGEAILISTDNLTNASVKRAAVAWGKSIISVSPLGGVVCVQQSTRELGGRVQYFATPLCEQHMLLPENTGGATGWLLFRPDDH